ncbi:MAG: ABC transporter ATP-binding protein [Planctomycetes bacterium]|nr:ABC transporter ATP-binding protein [Planctomycetota bacterium]
MGAVIDIDEVTKWYGSVIALTRVTARIRPGITALLGPNGAGKSTLIGIMTGQIRATRGEVRVLGQPVWGNHELNLQVGLCNQYDCFYEDLNAVDFIMAMARLAGLPRRGLDDAVRSMLRRVGLIEKAWQRPIRTYSKGMRQRTKLAQALMHEPRVVFLDEPMTGLDPVGRHEITAIIKGIAAAGGSVVVSTHILHEVVTMTDEILLLANGRVLAEGDVHEIRSSLENHPYRIKIVCDRPRRLAHALSDEACVESIGLDIDMERRGELALTTRRADLLFALLPRRADELGIQLEEVSSPDDNLEAVFDYLVHDRSMRGGF